MSIKTGTDENSQIVEYTDTTTLIDSLRQLFPWYLWIVRWAYDGTEIGSSIVPYLIGIRKVFTNDLETSSTSSVIETEHNLYKYYGYSNNRGFEQTVEYRLNVKYLYYSSYIVANYILYKNNIEDHNNEGTINIQYSDYKFSVNTLDGNINIQWNDVADRFDNYDFYGIDRNKIKEIEMLILNPDYDSSDPESQEFISLNPPHLQLFNEDRFVPIFHRLANIEDDTIHIDESFIVIPQLNYMKEIVKDSQEQPLWTFHNATTGENFVSENYQNQLVNITKPILSNFSPLQITPGYYDVILNARLWDNYNENEYQQQKIESIVQVIQ